MTDAQGAEVIALLKGITARLDAFAAMTSEPTECQHPEDARVSLSTFGDPDHWVCRICKFDNKQSLREALEAQ